MVLANFKSVLLYSILYYIWLCPYSKVEESFNIQASHDLLRYGDLLLFNDHRQQPTLNAKIAFDHLEFPGVVPRTFLGPIFLAAVSWPAHIIFHFLNLPLSCSQLIVRSSLGIISWYAFTEFSDAVSIRFGHRAGSLTNLLAALQFHMPFYMSRTLPNTFALIICLIAYSLWLRGRALSTLLLVAWAMMIFRCDLLLVIAPLTLQLLISREVPFWRTATRGIFTSVVALALSVSVDSYFWQRLTWPEGEVLYFNGVDNKSSEWGVMPWHWYLTNALPKVALPLSVVGILGLRYPFQPSPSTSSVTSDPPSYLILRPWSLLATAIATSSIEASSHPKALNIGVNDTTSIASNRHMSVWSICRLSLLGFIGPCDLTLLYYSLPAFCYVALYSFLPHKELRFIFPVLPVLIMAAAVALDKVLPQTSFFGWSRLKSERTEPKVRVTAKKATRDDGEEKGKDSSVEFNERYSSSCIITIKRVVDTIIWACFFCLLFLSVLLSGVFASASQRNYPGGEALKVLLQKHIKATHGDSESIGATLNGSFTCPADRISRVHIDVAAAMTGVTRFGQEPSVSLSSLPGCNIRMVYSKEEGLTSFSSFDWLLTDDPICSYLHTAEHTGAGVSGHHMMSYQKIILKSILAYVIILIFTLFLSITLLPRLMQRYL